MLHQRHTSGGLWLIHAFSGVRDVGLLQVNLDLTYLFLLLGFLETNFLGRAASRTLQLAESCQLLHLAGHLHVPLETLHLFIESLIDLLTAISSF